MKKLLLLLSFSASALLADFEIIKNKSVSFNDSDVTGKEVIYFGELANYSKEVVDIQKNVALKGTEGLINGVSNGSEALAKGFYSAGGNAIGAGVGIGLVIGLLDPFVMEFYADQKFIQVEKVTLKDGTVALQNSYFVGNKHPSYENEEIKDFINKDNFVKEIENPKEITVSNVSIEKDEGITIFKNPTYMQGSEFEATFKKSLAETLFVASEYGQKEGYKYFAIVNDKANNLSGYPINSYKGLVQYGKLYRLMKNREDFKVEFFNDKGKPLVYNKKVNMRVVFFKENVPGVFLFNIEDTLKETAAAI